MNALLIDAGNSRIKWALLRGGRVGTMHSSVWTKRNLAAVARHIAAHAGRAGAVLLATVASGAVEKALRTACRRARLPAPALAISQRLQAGVSNAYHWPEQLGIDRWLALLAARSLYPSESVCIVSIGTAVTIDLLDQRGRHRGGVIAPGPALMVESLLSATARIRQRARRRAPSRRTSPDRVFFAHDTYTAIHAGGLHGAAALTGYALTCAQELIGQPPRLLLTGGGAAVVQRLLAKSDVGLRARRINNLVLRGLAVLAQQDSS